MNAKKKSGPDLTAENQRLRESLEAREAELTVLNSIQDALVSNLDVDSIFDIVGDRLADIFAGHSVGLYTYDREADLLRPLYLLEDGARLYPKPIEPGPIAARLFETKQALVLSNRQEFEAIGSQTVEGTATTLSGIYAPMIVQDRVIGGLNIESVSHEHAFSEADLRLVTTITNSLSIALENVRLFEATNRLLEETEARNAELAIINTVQQALASELDIQGIYDAVGEKLRTIFDSQVVAIYFSDLEKRIQTCVYAFEKGQNLEVVSQPFSSLHDHLVDVNDTMVFNRNFPEFAAQFEDYRVSQGEMPQSIVVVPVPRMKDPGTYVSVTLQDVDGETEFTDADVRLLETLANSMGVALENARLFNETQRLLKETEQRAAELQIINSVQEGLASKLDMQAIHDLIGEKIQEIFDADTTFIAFHDREHDLIYSPYYNDRGARTKFASRKFGSGLAERVISSGESLMLGTAEEMRVLGSYEIASPGSDKDLNESFLGVPILRDGETIGVTSVQSYNQHAYTQTDLTLLQTLTNSMSVALENARLFAETERLLKESQQRAAELATINTVGQALVAEPDLEALIELIGEQIRQIFTADIVYVAMLEPEQGLIRFPYTYGEEFQPLKLGEGLTSKVIESGEPLLINAEMDKRREEMGVTRVGKRAASYLGVPIQMGGKTFGVISVQSTSDEDIFSENDMHLLNTIAANVSAAIRNARLFDEITRQKQYYQAVIENSPAAIVLLDLEATVTGWNPAAERLFGYSEEEAIGRNVDDLVASRADLHSEAVRYSNQALREKQVHLLARRTRKDGSLVEVDVSGLPVSVDGEYVGFIAIYHDVTELQRARLAAEEANRAKSTFLANMSHELRTPLNAIIGFTRIIRRKGAALLPEKQVENLDKVLVSAEHLLSLINTVLDISKIEAGRIEVNPGEFDLNRVIRQVIDTSQALLKEGVELRTELPDSLPALHTDQEKVKQILLNLLSNAAKFTHEGEIVLTARREGECMFVDVCDTGIGISADAIERVFEEFQQADSSTTRQYGGTGLGLSISRSLARLLGGELTVASVEGQGSTFTLSMPLRYQKPETSQGATQLEPIEVDPSPDRPVILSIDDDPHVHDMLAENLGEHGYQVIGASNGEDGLRLATELKPLAITLDIMMPQKDGWQVLHELKANSDTRDIPVILVTIVDKHSLGFKLGAADYLVKPLEEDAVLSVLARIRAGSSDRSVTSMLVIDDDPNIAELVRQLLEGEGYAVDAVPDGEMALERIAAETPDLIMLDLMMPGLDGFNLIEALERAGMQVPIVVLTAKDLSNAELELLQGSVEQIILKNGLDEERLMVEIGRTMEHLRPRVQAGD